MLEGTKTLAAKGGDRLPDNVDAVTSASVVPVQYRQTDWKPSGFTDAKDKKRALFILDDPRHESVTYDLCVTAMKFFEEKALKLNFVTSLPTNSIRSLLLAKSSITPKTDLGKHPTDVLTEQAYVKKADHIIFTYCCHQIVFVSRFFFWNFFFGIFFAFNNLLPFCPCISVTNKSDY